MERRVSMEFYLFVLFLKNEESVWFYKRIRAFPWFHSFAKGRQVTSAVIIYVNGMQFFCCVFIHFHDKWQLLFTLI